ncbi:ExeA family protein [Yersinia enterocolitica]|uniref:ExeA family protein n=1 Tax=Yersinia enterocolitica TaxID=630 RepID=UPI0030AC0A0E|nr:AAA family ATPase [Yersinia enterocolitica]
MYHSFFSLTETPFSLSPNPNYFFLSEQHREALAHLRYGLGKGGVVLLTGEAGTGKTTLSRYLQRELSENTDVVLLSAPLPDAPQLYQMLCQAFIPGDQGEEGWSALERFVTFLTASHRRQRSALLVIDEAQHLSVDILELLRLLTNIESTDKKCLQMILIGPPELQYLLNKPECRQLAQRITARYNLKPLTCEEVDAYIRFRLQVAGRLQPIFTPQAVTTIYRMSKGVPRVINQICERALLGAYGEGMERVSALLSTQAGYEVTGRQDDGGPVASLAFCVLCALFYVGGWFGWQQWGALPAPKMNIVKVSVALPQDARQIKAFRAAVENVRGKNKALSQLYMTWGYETLPETADCESASRANLHCYRLSGSLSEVLALNYPAVVQLKDEKLGNWYAVLSHIEGDNATLLFDNKEWIVSVGWLQQVWQKNATLFWPLPDSGTTLITGRSSTADLQWADKMLSEALGEPALGTRQLNKRIEEKIKVYQQKNGIQADGIAGEQTLMRLSQQIAQDIPRLNGNLPAREMTQESPVTDSGKQS